MIICNLNFPSVPKSIELSTASPSGLEIIDNFITEKEEHLMLQYFTKHWSESSKCCATIYILYIIIKFSLILRFNEASSSETLWI